MFNVYILQDEIRDKYYVGQTENLSDRLERHFEKRSRYTRTGNWKVVYTEDYQTRIEALSRERRIKAWKSKIMIKKLIGGP